MPNSKLEKFAQHWVWSHADHECGGLERGICGYCDTLADGMVQQLTALLALPPHEGETPQPAAESGWRRRPVRVEAWEGEDFVITYGGKPVGPTVTAGEGAVIARWLPCADAEIFGLHPLPPVVQTRPED